MGYEFFALMSRMKYIERWALMRNARTENICEHSLEVAMIAHGLAVIGNQMLHKELPEGKVALIAMYHDCTEIITGDMPTPVKYYNAKIKKAYKEVEAVAMNQLLETLPGEIRKSYKDLFFPKEQEEYVWKLVKAADKLSSLIKCIEERKAGNQEFLHAERSTLKSIQEMGLEEVTIFMNEFLSSYEKTLDELSQL